MAPYAHKTKVPVAQSQQEIEQLVRKRGGDQFVSGWSLADGFAQIGFSLNERMIKFRIPLPDKRTQAGFDAEVRRRWRCLLLVVKGKFEIVDSGIQTFEEAFLSDIVMSDGRTMGEWSVPQIARMYDEGEMPPLLTGPK